MTSTHVSAASSGTGVVDQISRLRESARAFLHTGDLVTAYDMASQAAMLGFKELGILHAANIESYLLVSELAGRLGQPAMSIVFAQNAFSTAEANGKPEDPVMGAVLRALGSSYGRAGDYGTAEELLQAAVAVHEEALGPDAPDVATDLVALVELYLRSNNSLALSPIPKMLKRARDIRVKAFGEKSVDVADIWRLYGESIAVTFPDATTAQQPSRDKVLEAGELALRTAEQIFEKHFDRPNPAFLPVYRSRGDLYMKAGRSDDAFDAYALALQSSGDAPVAKVALRLAVLAAKRNDVDLTLAACGAANAMSYREFREFARWAGIAEELTYRRRASPSRQLCLSLVYGLELPPAKKGRTLLDIGIRWRAAAARSERARYRMLRKPESAALLADVSELENYRRRLAQALVRTIRTGEADPESVSNILDELRRYEEILALETFSPGVARQGPTVTTQELAAHLPADSAILIIMKIERFNLDRLTWSGRGRYIALIVEPDGGVRLRDLGDAADLEVRVIRALDKFRSVDKLNVAPQLKLMSELYELVWEPVVDVLAPYFSIFTVSEGPISLVPLAALRNGDGQFLVQDKLIIHLTSPLDIMKEHGARERADRDALIISDPDFGAAESAGLKDDPLTFQRLKGTKAEVGVVASQFDGEIKVFAKERATEQAIHRLSKSRFVHFATHGYFLQSDAVKPAYALRSALIERGHDPIDQEIDMVRSGLAVAGANRQKGADDEDGILTALEIAGMDFSATELVTLSACDTGMGIVQNDEGVFGLRLAFQLADARNLIMSLWIVHSRELKRQMNTLYQLIRAGDPPPLALHKMQNERIRWYRKHHSDAPPAVWAAFIAQANGPIQRERPR